MSGPDFRIWYRPQNSANYSECENKSDRSKWTNEEFDRAASQSGGKTPNFSSFECASGPKFEVVFKDATKTELQVLHRHRPIQVAIETGSGHSALKNTFDRHDLNRLAITQDLSGQVQTAMVPSWYSPAEAKRFREQFFKQFRELEPNTTHSTVSKTTRTHGYLAKASIGPNIMSGQEISGRSASLRGNEVSDTSNSFFGAGFSFDVEPTWLRTRRPVSAPASSSAADRKAYKARKAREKAHWIAGAVLAAFRPKLSMSDTWLDASVVESSHPELTPSISYNRSGLRLAIGLDAQLLHSLHYMGTTREPTMHWNASLHIETPLLQYGSLKAEDFAAVGSSQPFDFSVSGMMTPFAQDTAVVLGAEWNHGDFALTFAYKYTFPFEIASNHGFNFELRGHTIMLGAKFGWMKFTDIERTTWSNTSVYDAGLPVLHRAITPPPPPVVIERTVPTPPVIINRPAPEPAAPVRMPPETAPPPQPKKQPSAAPLEIIQLPPRPEFKLKGGSNFDTAKATLKRKGQREAKRLANEIITYYDTMLKQGYAKETPVYATIRGYTDPRGSDDFNLNLSFRRAGSLWNAVKTELARQARKGRNVPVTIERVTIGYGRDPEHLIHKRDSFGNVMIDPKTKKPMVDNDASRRTQMSVTSSRAIFEADQAESRTREAKAKNKPADDPAKAVNLIAQLQIAAKRKNSGIESVFPSKDNRTLYIVADAPYRKPEESKHVHVRRMARRVLNTLRRKEIRTLLQNMSSQYAVALIAYTEHPSANIDVLSQRKGEIGNILHNFKKWPARGDAPIYEVAKATAGVSQLPEHMESLRAQREAQVVHAPAGSVAATMITKQDFDIDGRNTDRFTISQASGNLRFDSDGKPSPELLALMQELATKYKGHYSNVHLNLYGSPSGGGSVRPPKALEQMGLQMREVGGEQINFTFSWSNGDLIKPQLNIIAANSPFPVGDALKEALHKGVVLPQIKK